MEKFIINKNCERHKARLCEKLREAKIPEIAIDAVRKEFDYLKEDLNNALASCEVVSETKDFNR